MALCKQIQNLYRFNWKTNVFSNIPIILSWDESIIKTWLSAASKAKYPDDVNCSASNEIDGGDCHVFTAKILTALTDPEWTWKLLHNKQHGAAIVNPTSDFIITDSQARSAFQLIQGASWESMPGSSSEKVSTWSRDDEGVVTLDGQKYEEVSQDEFTRRQAFYPYAHILMETFHTCPYVSI